MSNATIVLIGQTGEGERGGKERGEGRSEIRNRDQESAKEKA